MNKYQKALEIVSHPMKYGIDKFDEALDLLKESLTPPTSDEVCKALSEYLNEKVWFENGCFYTGNINSYEAIIYSFDDDIHFSVVITPKIVTMIGRFYEGVIENER